MINTGLMDFLAHIAILFPTFLLAISFHEFSHALVAHLLGDDSAKDEGRLTLNPFVHLDFLGTILLLIVGIGWAKPVPMNSDNFKYPRIYSILTGLAGPFSNFLLALGSFVLFKYLPLIKFPPAVFKSFGQLLVTMADINVMLGVFNLLPIPPLDGSHFLFALLSKRFPEAIIWLYKYSIFILLILLMLPGFNSLLFDLISYVKNLLIHLVF
jgi:Zn-dependent protease